MKIKQHNKKFKVKLCKEYQKGDVSFGDLAKKYGITREMIRRWYLLYLEHGANVFDITNKTRHYSKQFKLSIVEKCISGKHSVSELAAKNIVSESTIRSWTNKWYNDIESDDLNPKGDISTMKSKGASFDERLEIVKWVIASDMNYKGAAEKYSVTYASVYRWTNAYINSGTEGLKHKKRGPKPKSDININDLTEVERLKFELDKERALRKRRDLEIEILKKKRNSNKSFALESKTGSGI
mgnify:CR=1 FL=1